MTEYMASSSSDGARPSSATTASYSSSVMPRRRCSGSMWSAPQLSLRDVAGYKLRFNRVDPNSEYCHAAPSQSHHHDRRAQACIGPGPRAEPRHQELPGSAGAAPAPARSEAHAGLDQEAGRDHRVDPARRLAHPASADAPGARDLEAELDATTATVDLAG